MNSVLDLVLIGVSEETATEMRRTVQREMSRLEKLLSRFNPEAETFAANQKAHNNWTGVSDALWDILQECERFNKLTLGYFNIGLGHFKKNAETIPTGISGGETVYSKPEIVLDYESRRVKFANRFTSLDFGAIGKGLLLKKVKTTLTDLEIENCFVSFGGSSILTLGKHPSGNAWPVSFRNDNGNSFVFHLNDHAVSISGARQGKEQIHHIINPIRLKLETSSRLVFVQDECPLRAEVLSTALVAAEENDFDQVINQFQPQKVSVFIQQKTNELKRIYEYEN
ncbi:FAD:protein FMN transferase [Mangrovibacterium lignilyticum]|uniref:FAD:protein FMN transferase n=1 Tax=Mangrovibacterium lignilyticum TaxID=2668052 RepID=UPI0013D5176A|nr:FAD:protein FMN transferase [Mangrovibacterium lignilyticum]